MESTPVSRASFGTRCGGMRLQSCPRTLSLDAVGLVFLFFHLCRVTELKNHSNHFFCALTKIPMGWLCKNLGFFRKGTISGDDPPVFAAGRGTWDESICQVGFLFALGREANDWERGPVD